MPPPLRDVESLNQNLANIANQNDPVSPFGISGVPGITAESPVATSQLEQLIPLFDIMKARQEQANPDLALAQRQAAVDRFQNRQGIQEIDTGPGEARSFTNQGGPNIELQQQAGRAQDPNFPAAVQGRRQELLAGGDINTDPRIIQSLLAGQRNEASIQGRADLAGQNIQGRSDLAGQNITGREGVANINQAGQNERARLRAMIDQLGLGIDIEQEFPETFGFGGPSENVASQQQG